jgi:hypothetical protein
MSVFKNYYARHAKNVVPISIEIVNSLYGLPEFLTLHACFESKWHNGILLLVAHMFKELCLQLCVYVCVCVRMRLHACVLACMHVHV